MLAVREAEEALSANIQALPVETVSLEHCRGRVLREPIVADRPFPPYHRITMDGIALSLDAYRQGARRMPVEGIQRVGQPPETLKDPSHCLEVVTGAALPNGCDVVVPVEDLDMQGGVASLKEDLVLKPLMNVHQEGSDRRAGEELVSPGKRLSAPSCGVAAAVGQSSLAVTRMPEIAVVSTGDELVGVEDTPSPQQVRRSNPYALCSALREAGCDRVALHHFPDDRGQMRAGIEKLLAPYDVILLTGGVSKGRFDFVPDILAELGVVRHFHRVRQTPGKPLWFGTGPGQQVVFGLPGNPVSVLVCFYRYVRPALDLLLGIDPDTPEYAVLEEDVTFAKPLTFFQPVQVLGSDDGRLKARPVRFNTSGDLASLASAHGFLELDESEDVFKKDTAHRLWRW